jgi:hypothetical protein
MALETGTYISDLVDTNPLSSDLKSQGDDHIRLIKKTIKNTFPNIAGEVDATHTALSAANRGKNKIINGDFSVWQRGTSFAPIGDYSADRWKYSRSGVSVHTASRSTDVPTVVEAGRLFNYSILIGCTTADVSVAAGDFVILGQRIEGYNFLSIAQRAFKLSFWVKATKTGTYCVAFRNGGLDRSYVVEYTVDASDTWEYKTVNIAASPSAGTWNYTNGIGLQFNFTLMAGSTFQTTADVWQTGDYVATANQVNASDSTSNNFRVTGVQIEAGVDATEFEHKLYSETLADCQRYYWRGLPCTVLAYPSYATGSLMSWPVKFPVTMRSAPTVNSDFTGIILNNTGTPSVLQSQADGLRLTTTSTGVATSANFTFAGGNYIEADSEL